MEDDILDFNFFDVMLLKIYMIISASLFSGGNI